MGRHAHRRRRRRRTPSAILDAEQRSHRRDTTRSVPRMFGAQMKRSGGRPNGSRRTVAVRTDGARGRVEKRRRGRGPYAERGVGRGTF